MQLIYIICTYIVENSILIFITNSLPLLISDAEFHKDPFLDLCYFCCIINNMPQAVDCDLFLYVDDTCLLFQDKDLEQVKAELIKNFSNYM